MRIRQRVEYSCALSMKVSWRIPETRIWTLSSLLLCCTDLHCSCQATAMYCNAPKERSPFLDLLLQVALLNASLHCTVGIFELLQDTARLQFCPALSLWLSANVLWLGQKYRPSLLGSKMFWSWRVLLNLLQWNVWCVGHNVVFRFEKEECLRF